jgi:hypothetical protein
MIKPSQGKSDRRNGASIAGKASTPRSRRNLWRDSHALVAERLDEDKAKSGQAW